MRLPYRFSQMLCLLAALSGCMGWRTSTVEPAIVIAQDHPGSVRVTRQDGSRLIIYKPVVEADSLRGRVGRRPVALPLADVASVAVTKTKVGATVFSLTLVAAFVALAIAASSFHGISQ